MSHDDASSPRPGKPYQPPKLVDYGSTSKLSAAKPGNIADAPSSSQKTCL
jgi:hypothetical protein